MGVWEELAWRGLIHQSTADDLGDILAAGPITLYNGYDPTARSLHVGHLLPLTLMKHLQRAGHRVIGLVGGGTGQIGDPSGKSAERNLLDPQTTAENVASLKRQIDAFLDDPSNPPIYANNLDWLGGLGLIEFLRDTGKHFSVNAMIQKDSVKTRIEREGEGISFTEFTYSLLQARDFLELYRREGCVLQTGGSDQWGNIVAGVELIRRVEGARAYGLTVPLLTDSEGRKFGKSEGAAVFLDPDLTSPYEFYQFWVNVADADVERLLKLFTFRSQSDIADLATAVGGQDRLAQKALAFDMTAAVHGAEEADKAVRASAALFGGRVGDVPAATLDRIFADVPAIAVPPSRFAGAGANLIDLLVEVGACPSRGDARRQLAQGAIKLNGESPDGETVAADRLIEGRLLVIRRGKKHNYLVRATEPA